MRRGGLPKPVITIGLAKPASASEPLREAVSNSTTDTIAMARATAYGILLIMIQNHEFQRSVSAPHESPSVGLSDGKWG